MCVENSLDKKEGEEVEEGAELEATEVMSGRDEWAEPCVVGGRPGALLEAAASVLGETSFLAVVPND